MYIHTVYSAAGKDSSSYAGAMKQGYFPTKDMQTLLFSFVPIFRVGAHIAESDEKSFYDLFFLSYS